MPGASTKTHPAPYPTELAERLIRMFSFVGDTVLDPFMGSGTTNVAASRWDRSSIGYEISADYVALARERMDAEREDMSRAISVNQPMTGAATRRRGERRSVGFAPREKSPTS